MIDEVMQFGPIKTIKIKCHMGLYLEILNHCTIHVTQEISGNFTGRNPFFC